MFKGKSKENKLNKKDKNKKKKNQKEEEQIFDFSTIPSDALNITEKDFISPSIISETSPTDILAEGYEVGDYYVAVGNTIETTRYYRSLYVELIGGNTIAGMFDKLYTGDFGQGNLDANVDIALHVIPVETSTELDKINSRIRGIKSDLYKKIPDEKRIKLEDELEDKMAQADRLRLNLQKAFKVCIQVVVSSTDLKAMKKMVSLISRRMSGSQIYMKAADGKQLDAFLNLLPTKDDPTFTEHTYSFETNNVADMFMFGNGKISHRTGVVWGVDHFGRPIMYDAWNRTLPNRNAIITGISGGGKTFSACKLMHHDVLRGVRHAIICPKGDYRRYVEEMGCPYFDFGSSSDKRINFFDVEIEEIEVEKNTKVIEVTNVESTILAASAIVFKMIRVYEPALLTGIAKSRIEKTIREMYFQEFKITQDPNSLFEEISYEEGMFNTGRQRKKMPQLSDLQRLLEEKAQKNNDETLAPIAEILKDFTQGDGTPTERAIFDCQSNINLNDVPLFAFGLSALDKEIMKPIGLFISTKWLASKFSHKNREIQKRLVVDEAQVIMEDDETAIWLENEFRIVRFFNTSMMALTQGFEVFTRSENGLGIIKNSPTKLFLKQDKYDENILIEKFNLTKNEATFLINEAREGTGILRINEERSIITVTATAYEEFLFETEPNKLAEKRAAYEREKARKEKRKAFI